MAVLEPCDTRRSVPPDRGELGPPEQRESGQWRGENGPSVGSSCPGPRVGLPVSEEWSPLTKGSPTLAAQ